MSGNARLSWAFAFVTMLVSPGLAAAAPPDPPLVFYVTTTGSDIAGSNSCENPSSPCLTISQAVKQAYRHPTPGGGSQHISIAAGTYNETINVSAALLPDSFSAATVSEGQIWLKGAGPDTIIAGDGAQCGTIIATGRAIIGLQQLRLLGNRNPCQSTIFAQEAGFINLYDGISFGPASQQHLHSEEGGQIEIWGSYVVNGGAKQHWGVTTGGIVVYNPNAIQVTISGEPVFAQFGLAQHGGIVQLADNTSFFGAARGMQFIVESGGMIVSNNAKDTPIPGDAFGIRISGGILFPEAKLVRVTNEIGDVTGLGEGGHAMVSTAESGRALVTLAPAAAPSDAGSVQVLWGAANQLADGTSVPCVATLSDDSGVWAAGASIKVSGSSESPPQLKLYWSNSGEPLLPKKIYRIAVLCS